MSNTNTPNNSSTPPQIQQSVPSAPRVSRIRPRRLFMDTNDVTPTFGINRRSLRRSQGMTTFNISFSPSASPSTRNELERRKRDKFDTDIVQTPKKNKSSESKCSICLEEQNDDNKFKSTRTCKHLFHADCLFEWVNTQQNLHRTPKCPNCRTVLEKN